MIVKNTTAAAVYLPIYQPETAPNALNAYIPASATVDLVADGNASVDDISTSETLRSLVRTGTLLLVIDGTELSAAQGFIALAVYVATQGTIRSPETGLIQFTEQDGTTAAVIEAKEFNALDGHWIGRSCNNDAKFYFNCDQEQYQITRHSSGDTHFTSVGGTMGFSFNGATNLQSLGIDGTVITATPAALNYVDLTSSAQTQIDTKASADDAALTGTTTAEAIDCSGDISALEYNSAGGHLKFRTVTADATFYLADSEQFQIARNSSGDTHFVSAGGSKGFSFNGLTNVNGLKINGTEVTATPAALNYVDLTSSAQTQIDAKLDDSQKGAANGLAELDSSGLVPTSQLPSYVDDVLEYANLAAFPGTGEDSKIYVAEDTNKTYRWSGSAYVEISPSLALGETSATAYRGDRGKTAYDHSQVTSGNPHGVTATEVGLGNCDNTGDADKPVSTATQTALDLKANLSSPHFTGNVGIGTSTPDADSVLTVNGEGKYGSNGVMAIEDNTAVAAGNGGGIALKGIRDVAGNQTVYASVRAQKENATAGQFGANLELGTRANGSGDVEVGFTVNSDQTCTTASDLTVAGNIAVTGTVDGIDLADLAPKASPVFSGNVAIGTSSPDGDTVFTVNGEGKYGTNGVMSIEDNTAMEAGNGGGIALKGIRDAAGNQTVYGGIRAQKDNSTGGHYGASIELVTRANGSGDPEVGFTVNSDQTCATAGDLTVNANIAVTGTVDGVDVAALGAEVAENKGHHVDITDSTTTVNVGAVIKAGSYIESCSVLITEAFTGGSSPTIIIGDTSDTDGFASLSTSDIGSTQRIISNGAAYSGSVLAGDKQPIVTVTGSPTAGAATVVITTRAV